MRSDEAFARGLAHQDDPSMVFDWTRAAELIRDRKPQQASAGLADDWEWTGGPIYRDGHPVPRQDTYTFLSSTWATPELNMDGDVVECWRLADDTPGWDSSTYWPDEALVVLNAEVTA